MRGSIGRKFASGAVSRKQAARFNFGATSENPEGLKLDDGGIWSGSIRQDHINDKQYVRPRKGSGFPNPERDYGSARVGVDHIDERKLQKRDVHWPRQKDRSERANLARVRMSSGSEYWSSSWYSDPPRRQK